MLPLLNIHKDIEPKNGKKKIMPLIYGVLTRDKDRFTDVLYAKLKYCMP